MNGFIVMVKQAIIIDSTSMHIELTFVTRYMTVGILTSELGLDQLCWHNFENNRHLKELGIC